MVGCTLALVAILETVGRPQTMKRKRPHEESRTPSPAALQPARRTVAALWRPWLLGGMMAIMVARPMFPSESAASFGDGLTAVMLWIALAVFWLLGRSPGRGSRSASDGPTPPCVLLVRWHTVAAVLAVAHGTPRPAMNMLWEWIGMGLCFFLARQLIDTAREARAVVAVMIALAVALSGYGLYQRAYELPGRGGRSTRPIPIGALHNVGLWMPPNSPGRKLFEDRLANVEPTATFALTNSLAGFLTPWLVVLAGLIGSTLRKGKRPWAMIVALIPIAACLLLTKSRSGYAGGGRRAVVGVAIFCREKKFASVGNCPLPLAVVVALLISAAAVVEGPAVLGRASKSFGYRLQYWQSSLRMIAAHPWFGCGPGNFQEVYTQYKLPEASEEIADPHNFLIEIWATAGTPAALAFLGVLGCFVWQYEEGEAVPIFVSAK